MKLEDLQEEYRTVTTDKLVTGALIETILGEDDGLVFKNGRHSKPKKIIIVGVDKESNTCYGSVMVNTNMNPKANYSEPYLAAQYLLKQENYENFLRYDSFVDCGEVFSFPIDKLLKGEYYGTLNDQDKQGIFDILETTSLRSGLELEEDKNDAKRNRPQWHILKKWLKEVTLQTDKMLKTSQTEPSPMARRNRPNGANVK